MISAALSKVTATGSMTQNLRGKNGRHNAIEEERERPVIEHIQQFLTVESHYVRGTANYQYLPEELTIKQMHRMNKKWCTEKGIETQESYDFHRRTFQTRFNLKMHKPKKDVCDLCTAYEQVLVYKLRQAKKKSAREYKAQLKEVGEKEEGSAVAAFDLKKTLLCSYGQTSFFYYLLRLRNYNFTITDINSMKTVCCLS